MGNGFANLYQTSALQSPLVQPLGLTGGVQQQLSPQFLGAVLSALPSIIPIVANALSQLQAQPQLAQASALQPMGVAAGLQQQQLSPQFLGAVLNALPSIIPIVANVISQLQAQPQMAQVSALQPMGLQPLGMTAGLQQQQLSPQGIFDAVLRNVIPIAIETIRRLEAQPQLAQASALQPMGVGAGVEQQLSPQFLNVLLPIVTSLIPPLVNMIRR